MRQLYLGTSLLVILTVAVLGFRGGTFTHPPMDVFPEWLFPGMKRQPRYKSQGSSEFFADGRADRLPPPGTIPADADIGDGELVLGKKSGGSWVRGFPRGITVDMSLLERGRDRYAIYCTPCHGLVGDGNGVTKRYGMGATPSYHDDRLRQMAEGEIYNTITNGKQPANNMPSYADKLIPADRWAVVAYVRALQRAQTGKIADVPADHRAQLGIK
jgi:mono/diheme cytochrome c family protein